MTRLRELFEIYPAEPRATMPIGLRVDGTVFVRVDGVDMVSGAPPPHDAHSQLRVALPRLRHAIETGGTSLEALDHVTAYVHPAVDLAAVVDDWRALVPEAASVEFEVRPAILPPARLIVIDALAGVEGASASGETTAFADGAASAAVRIGSLLWSQNVTARDAIDGSMPSGGIKVQVESAFDNMERLLERAGSNTRQILRIAGYMRDLKDKDLLNDAMVRRFPEWSQKPVHKYVPAALPPGVEFALQAIAVDGAERRIVEIEGIKHNDPISLGAQAGNVFVSSRVQARLEQSAREQAARLIEEHARRLVEHIGGSLEDVSQMVWGIGDPTFEADVRAECARHWSPGQMPRLDFMQADFPHSPLPRLEFFALLADSR